MIILKTSFITGSEVDWVQCDGGCDKWFHMLCVGIDKNSINTDDDYYCVVCKINSPLPDNKKQNTQPESNKDADMSCSSQSNVVEEKEGLPGTQSIEGNNLVKESESKSVSIENKTDSILSNTEDVSLKKNDDQRERPIVNNGKCSQIIETRQVESTGKNNVATTITYLSNDIDNTNNVNSANNKISSADQFQADHKHEGSMAEKDYTTSECNSGVENKVACSLNITSTLDAKVSDSDMIESEKQVVF